MVSDAFTLNIAALEKVIEWSTEQASIVRLAVVEYLESPDDERLSDVLNLCGIEKENRKTRKEDTLTALLKRSLPATLEELYVVARRNHRSNRPEAAVRQTLRNLKKRGLVSEDERGRISLTANLDSPT